MFLRSKVEGQSLLASPPGLEETNKKTSMVQVNWALLSSPVSALFFALSDLLSLSLSSNLNIFEADIPRKAANWTHLAHTRDKWLFS